MKTDSLIDIPASEVDVVEPRQRARAGWIRLEIGSDIQFNTAGLESYCFANRDPEVYDALVVAAAVKFCDATLKRPAYGWTRRFFLRVPVHNPSHWMSLPVSEALHDALSFLTGDRWEIEFKQRKQAAPLTRQGNLHLPDAERIVMPFSDGLDSLAVAGLMRRSHGEKLLLVRLGSAAIAGSTSRGTIPFAVVPCDVPLGRNRVESSARSRGFQFALLSGIAAHLSDARTAVISESGQGAIGPALVPVGDAYVDYRNHPSFLRRMEMLLAALFNKRVVFSFPRIWATKGETLSEFVRDCGRVGTWEATRSCWQDSRQVAVDGQRRQCGVCAACLLRRMSVHSCGLREPSETYVWEDLTAGNFASGAAPSFNKVKPDGALARHAIAGVRHLDDLSALRSSKLHAKQVSRVARELADALSEDASAVEIKIDRMLSAHRKEWENFLDSLGRSSFLHQWVNKANDARQ